MLGTLYGLASTLKLVTGLVIVCPMTSRIKNYAFEVVVSRAPPSAVLADQLKSVDWRARRAVRKGSVAPEIMAQVKAKISSLLRFAEHLPDENRAALSPTRQPGWRGGGAMP
jgi:hypothetical protein